MKYGTITSVQFSYIFLKIVFYHKLTVIMKVRQKDHTRPDLYLRRENNIQFTTSIQTKRTFNNLWYFSAFSNVRLVPPFLQKPLPSFWVNHRFLNTCSICLTSAAKDQLFSVPLWWQQTFLKLFGRRWPGPIFSSKLGLF